MPEMKESQVRRGDDTSISEGIKCREIDVRERNGFDINVRSVPQPSKPLYDAFDAFFSL
jgi:hypothetical protein